MKEIGDGKKKIDTLKTTICEKTRASGLIRIPLKPILKAALYSWVRPGFVINETFEKQFILGLSQWNWKVNTQGYSGVMPKVFRTEDLSKLHMPILMLIGDHDKLNPPSAIEQARQMIPHIQTEIIPDAGHTLSMEQPGRVDKSIIRFLA